MGLIMSVSVGAIEWDGEALVGTVTVDGKLTSVRFGREAIHQRAPGFNDALDWEIERHRIEIVQKLIPLAPG